MNITPYRQQQEGNRSRACRRSAAHPARAAGARAETGPAQAIAAIRSRLDGQLSQMARQLSDPAVSTRFGCIRQRASALLETIGDLAACGRIRLSPPLRVLLADPAPPPPPDGRPIRLGVFPVTANPMHWGHLLCALEAIALLALDQVVFIVQGVDPRKEAATRITESDRHELARQAICVLHPLAVYSDIGRGNSFVGEHNIFRLLRLNSPARIIAHYLVGADHYRLLDAHGLPDTLLRLERNVLDPALGFDQRCHELSVVFIERGLGRRRQRCHTNLPVRFVPAILDCSSTDVRNGDATLAPHVVFSYLQHHPEYARSIGFVPPDVAE